MKLDVLIIEACTKEIKLFPKEIINDFLSAVALLKEGIKLSLPLSRPMPSVGPGVHELRLKDKNGIYRVFYLIKKKDAIYIVHAFNKKTQKTPQKTLELVKKKN